MSAAKNNFVIEKWASFKSKLTYRTGSGRAVNLSFCTAKLQLRASLTSEVLFELSTTNGRIKPLSQNGVIEFLVSAADTGAIVFTNAVYDLVVTFADGTKIRLLEGKFTVVDGVTR